MNIADFVLRLEKVKRTGKQYSARCPAHNDSKPSLSVSEGDDGKIIMICHAGCTNEQIVEAMGLTMGDLFSKERPNSNGPRILEAYDYTDEDGIVLFQSVRYVPKDFRLRRPDGDGGWIKGVKDAGVRKVIYNLPAVKRAIDEGERIFIPEGEKDANRLTREGFTATTNVMGAGKWDAAYTKQLEGAHDVVVIADDDEPGIAHARDVAASLECHVESVVIMRSPHAKDVFEHFEKGYGVDDFVPLEDEDNGAHGDSKIVLADFTGIVMRRTRWLYRERIPLGCITLVAGGEGIGKSTVVDDWAARLTNGTLPGEFVGQPRDALIYATEDSLSQTIKPRLVAAGADLTRVHHVVMQDGIYYLEMPRDIEDLAAACRGREIAMIVLDPLISRLTANLNTDKDDQVRKALEPLKEFAEELRLSVLGIMHFNKSGSTDPMKIVMASKAFTAVPRAVMFAARHPDEDGQYLIGLAKANLGRLDLPSEVYSFDQVEVGKDPDDGRPIVASKLVWHGDSEISMQQAIEAEPGDRSMVEEAAEWLADFIQVNGGYELTQKIYREARKAGHNDRTLRRARMRTEPKIEVYKRGMPAVYWWRFEGITIPMPIDDSLIGEPPPVEDR